MSEDRIREIFENHRNIAVVGISRNPDKPSSGVPKYLLLKGYNIIPVNPYADEIFGRKSYKNLFEVEEEIDIVEVFRPSEEVKKVVQEAIERKKKRGDIKVIWLQEDIKNEDAKKLAEKEGIIFVQDKCMYKEHIRIYGE